MIIEIKSVKGYYNGKTYSSKKADHRIYVDRVELHVDSAELTAATSKSNNYKTIEMHKGVVSVQGVEGFWNGKTYQSAKSDHRIYVNNKELHVTTGELSTIEYIDQDHSAKPVKHTKKKLPVCITHAPIAEDIVTGIVRRTNK